MMKLLYLFTFLLLVPKPGHSLENKIIFLIVTPRSLSTPFTRMMANRGDFDCFSEPCMPVFFKFQNPEFGLTFNE